MSFIGLFVISLVISMYVTRIKKMLEHFTTQYSIFIVKHIYGEYKGGGYLFVALQVVSIRHQFECRLISSKLVIFQECLAFFCVNRTFFFNNINQTDI